MHNYVKVYDLLFDIVYYSDILFLIGKRTWCCNELYRSNANQRDLRSILLDIWLGWWDKKIIYLQGIQTCL